jgi:hypothetical protein
MEAQNIIFYLKVFLIKAKSGRKRLEELAKKGK